VGDLEREQARARAFQGEADKLKAELASQQKPEGNAAGDGDGLGFDLDSFRRRVLQETVAATQVAQAAAALRAKFPHADSVLFNDLASYGSEDALRVAVEDSHNRVASIIEAQVAEKVSAARAEMEQKYGGGSAGTPSGGSTDPSGDPSAEAVLAMDMDELNALEARSPGVFDRILRSAA
jgi:hypothetical protein